MVKINGILVTALLVILPTLVSAQDFNVRRIEVYGTSTIRVVPDVIVWTVGVQYDSDDLRDVKNNIERSTSRVLNVLSSAGVKETDIYASGLSVYKNYVQPEYGTKKYSGSNTITFKLHNTDMYEGLLDQFFDIENVFTSPPAREYSREIETRREARQQALLAAQQKAEEIARVMNVSLGRVYSIMEEPVSYGFYSNVETNRLMDQTSNTFSEGTIMVEARVKVVYELQ